MVFKRDNLSKSSEALISTTLLWLAALHMVVRCTILRGDAVHWVHEPHELDANRTSDNYRVKVYIICYKIYSLLRYERLNIASKFILFVIKFIVYKV